MLEKSYEKRLADIREKKWGIPGLGFASAERFACFEERKGHDKRGRVEGKLRGQYVVRGKQGGGEIQEEGEI